MTKPLTVTIATTFLSDLLNAHDRLESRVEELLEANNELVERFCAERRHRYRLLAMCALFEAVETQAHTSILTMLDNIDEETELQMDNVGDRDAVFKSLV